MTKIGYSRVSTVGQKLDRQIKQLKAEGCEVIYQDKISGSAKSRPELNKMLEELKEGDLVLVTDLTRISRSSQHLFELVEIFRNKKANLKSIKDTWLDLSEDNPYSHFLLLVMSGVAQLERDLIAMRVREGVAIAKEKGKYLGRPVKYSDKNSKLLHALELYEEGNKTVKQICEITGVGRSTLYEKIKERGLVRT